MLTVRDVPWTFWVSDDENEPATEHIPRAFRDMIATSSDRTIFEFDLDMVTFMIISTCPEVAEWVHAHPDRCRFVLSKEVLILSTHLPTWLRGEPDDETCTFFRTSVFPYICKAKTVRGTLDQILAFRTSCVFGSVHLDACSSVQSLLPAATQIRTRFPSVRNVTSNNVKWECVWQQLHNSVPAGWWLRPVQTNPSPVDTAGIEDTFLGFDLRSVSGVITIQHKNPPVFLALDKRFSREPKFRLGVHGHLALRGVMFRDVPQMNGRKAYRPSIDKLITPDVTVLNIA